MIKTTNTTEDPSAVFINELNSNFKEAFLKFLDEVKDGKHKGRFDKQPSFFDSLLNKNSYSDIYINAYLNADMKLEFTFANDSFLEQRFPKDKHKCQQFHIVKLKPTSKYFSNLYDIYIGNDISEKTKAATLKTIYNKILKVHYELTTELLEFSEINSPHNHLDEGDIFLGYSISHIKSIFTYRFVSDDMLCSLPDDLIKVVADEWLPGRFRRDFGDIVFIYLYPKFLARLLDYRVAEEIKDRSENPLLKKGFGSFYNSQISVVQRVIASLSDIDAHYIIKLLLENMMNGKYPNSLFQNNSDVLKNILEQRVFTEETQSKQVESLRDDIYSLATDIFISEKESINTKSFIKLLELISKCKHTVDVKKIICSFDFIDTHSLYDIRQLIKETKDCNNVKYLFKDVDNFLITEEYKLKYFKDVNSDIASGKYSIYVEEELRDMFIDCILTTFKLFSFKHKRSNKESELKKELVEYNNIIKTFIENIKCK